MRVKSKSQFNFKGKSFQKKNGSISSKLGVQSQVRYSGKSKEEGNGGKQEAKEEIDSDDDSYKFQNLENEGDLRKKDKEDDTEMKLKENTPVNQILLTKLSKSSDRLNTSSPERLNQFDDSLEKFVDIIKMTT